MDFPDETASHQGLGYTNPGTTSDRPGTNFLSSDVLPGTSEETPAVAAQDVAKDDKDEGS